MAFENITPTIEGIVQKSGIQEGLCLVNAMHITASVFINDDEPGLHADYKKWLEGWLPSMSHRSGAPTTGLAKTTLMPI